MSRMCGPDRVWIYEVAPRDGLQNEAQLIGTAAKAGFIRSLAATGVHYVEVTSFVRPDWIPQLSDSIELAAALSDRLEGGPLLGALVPNRRGLENFQKAPLDVVAVFLSASEGHNRHNLNRSMEESLAEAVDLLHRARAMGFRTRAYLSVAFGCPYDGTVPSDRVLEMLETLEQAGAQDFSLGDTTGVAYPEQVRRLCEQAAGIVGIERLGLHLHDTRGTALANAIAGWEVGVARFDGSVGGAGGCPYAPGASGNVATGDLVDTFHRLGVETGIDPHALLRCALELETLLQRKLPGRILRATSAPLEDR